MTNLDELVSAARSLDEVPPPETGRRMWANVAARVGGAAAVGVAVATVSAQSASAATTGATAAAGTAATATATGSVGLTLAKVGAAIALTAGVGVGVAQVATPRPEPAPSVQTVQAAEEPEAQSPRTPMGNGAAEEAIEVLDEPEEVIEIVEETPKREAKTRARARKRPAPEPREEPVKPASALAAESDLLGRAKVAASGGRNAAALRAIRRHAKAYPNGELSEVRRALEVKVLCSLGRVDEARRAADRFLKRHRASALAGQVRSSCAYGADE